MKRILSIALALAGAVFAVEPVPGPGGPGPVPPPIPQSAARVGAALGQGNAKPFNLGAADLVVTVNDWVTGMEITTLNQTNFHVFFAGDYGHDGCVSEDTMQIVSFNNVGNGTYQLKLGFKAGCTGWMHPGQYMAQVAISSPTTPFHPGYVGRTVARVEVN